MRQIPSATILTMSWDDGHPADLRVAELMASYGIRGTFYVPMRNCEGRPVMTGPALRELAALHEVGSHTFSHRRLDTVSVSEAECEVVSGKGALEDVLGHPVAGFCYPSGHFRTEAVALVRSAGFRYARGIVNLRGDRQFDRFMMPTTLQVYPHDRSVYLRNFIRGGDWERRSPFLPMLMRANPLVVRLIQCFDYVRRHFGNPVAHFWGHSWELDRIGGWSVLDEFFRYLVDQPDVVMLRNGEVCGEPQW